ncbi:hypothetical protein BpHYR1_037864 [Brachionus plicatilis]|uniref:Uncharacterized protein n=1 Tax=Brachionus plicatilis TaxID=10195 RepID=A0A3M7RRJ0_BRAPC|nr:hypothetical protein BpHYR1_037864 [Brachionus plicatilis]
MHKQVGKHYIKIVWEASNQYISYHSPHFYMITTYIIFYTVYNKMDQQDLFDHRDLERRHYMAIRFKWSSLQMALSVN